MIDEHDEAPYLGIDLAWSGKNETGLVALQEDGRISDAGWLANTEDVASWIDEHAGENSFTFIDAPLVIENPEGMRDCEKEVGHRYGSWKVFANASNLSSTGREGVALRGLLEERGFRYDDGTEGNEGGGRRILECYPYTTIVGVRALGYDHERPRYKRKPPKMPAASWRELRASETDELIRRVSDFVTEDPPMYLTSHPETLRLVDLPTPQSNVEAKHREDLLDAALCAWTAALWDRYGTQRCQVLGENDAPVNGRRATIIAPARESQRRR